MGKTRIGISLFVVTAALGQFYTFAGYSHVSNVISELAAQNTPGNYIMAASFLLLGASIAADGIGAYRPPLLPFIAFGIFFEAAGLFGHKPISPSVPYLAWLDSAHSLLATLSGIALTIGFAWQCARASDGAYKLLAFAIAAVCIGLPLLMLQWPTHQGLIQRVMYLVVYAWLWAFYPDRTHA